MYYVIEKCGKSYTQSSHLKVHKIKCKGQSSLQKNDTASTTKIQEEIELKGEEMMLKYFSVVQVFL